MKTNLKRVVALWLLVIGLIISLPGSSQYCPVPPYIYAPNQGTLIPYRENHVIVGELCVWAGEEDILDCSCIGKVFYY